MSGSAYRFRLFIFMVLLCSMAVPAVAQRCYRLVERSDLRRYDNGTYSGLVNRTVRAVICPSEAPAGVSVGTQPDDPVIWYNGFFYRDEQTRHDGSEAAAGIHDSIPAVFYIRPDGQLVMYEDHGFPSFRSFPSFPQQPLHPGDSWTASAVRAADPLNKGIVTKLPMEVAYTFVGEEPFNGEPVYRLKAAWATRYGALYIDFGGDADLQKAAGSHRATVLVSKATGNAVFMQDQADETFWYRDGNSVTLKGTITLFTEYPPAIPRDRIMPALNRIAEVLSDKNAGSTADSEPEEPGKISGHRADSSGPVSTDTAAEPDSGTQSAAVQAAASSSDDRSKITVETTPAGLRLSIRDLQFIADSSELLPEEKNRLDKIAAVLKLAPDAQFLVEGHTASTGKTAGERKLSEERARSIAAALAVRGIPAGKFICRGWGAARPVADNKTPEGRARNRRVEITIIGS
jgi:outer membrane protein OmpA-like peptidoglycan-associated protein